MTSYGVKPMVSPAAQTTSHMAAMILVLFIVTHLSLCCASAKRSRAGGSMVLKVCNLVMQCCHRKAMGMACSAMANRISLDTIFLRGEAKAEAEAGLNGCCLMKNWRSWRRKMVGGVGGAPTIFLWPEEKE